MIPKTIHYCWFGRNPLPKDALRCIESWKKFLPDYEIKQWNEDNFDIDICPYVRQAYDAGKYAFVSDYARFYILYHHGGVYFDTDVEVIKPLDHILDRGPFMAIEKSTATENPESGLPIGVAPGLGLAAEPHSKLIGQIIDIYNSLDFNPDKDGTIVGITTAFLRSIGLENKNEIQQIEEFTIYPDDYFCPMDHTTGLTIITPRTVTIHHYTASWVDHNTLHFRMHQLKNLGYQLFGKSFMNKLISIFK